MLVGATQLGERDGEISEKRNTQESAVFLRWITDEVVPNRVGLGAAVATPLRRIDVEMSPTALVQGMASAASTSEPLSHRLRLEFWHSTAPLSPSLIPTPVVHTVGIGDVSHHAVAHVGCPLRLSRLHHRARSSWALGNGWSRASTSPRSR
jgi:hypothetical protein